MSGLDDFRFEMLNHLSGLPSFSTPWSTWESKIRNLLGTPVTEQTLYELGNNLSEVFQSNIVSGRSNQAVSQGGTAWECLVAWYLNFILYGTNVVVIRPHVKFMPSVIQDALAVTIGNNSTNTESDLVAFTIPEIDQMSDFSLEKIDAHLRLHLNKIDLSIIQCKTNWNDNAQIPMLWDLIYSTKQFRVPNVSVGSNGVGPASFNNFNYSFVTVPTSRGSFNPTSLAVLRVRNLSGGNYWGHATNNGVAKGLSEFFTANFAHSFAGSVQNSIKNNLLANQKIVDCFLKLKFT